MAMEDDFQMALCVVKVIALVVIASSLMTISSGMRGGFLGRDSSVLIDGYDGTGRIPGPGRATETSQGYFGSRFEPPVFWNLGDLSIEDSQKSMSRSMVAYNDVSDIYQAIAEAKLNPSKTATDISLLESQLKDAIDASSKKKGNFGEYRTRGTFDPNLPLPY